MRKTLLIFLCMIELLCIPMLFIIVFARLNVALIWIPTSVYFIVLFLMRIWFPPKKPQKEDEHSR